MPDVAEQNGIARAILQGMDRLGFKTVGALARIFGALAAKNEETFWYRTQVDLAAAVGATANSSIVISQEADFVCGSVMATVYDATTGTIQPNSNWRVVMIDGGSDRQMMSPAGITRQNMAGIAERPLFFHKYRLFRRNSTISFAWTNLEAVGRQVELVLFGYKIFDEAALNLTVRR
jgi:hypothetical protein